jgi:Type III restriction enzyme, res subunit
MQCARFVHRRELLTQWVERLRTFLDIDPKDIGVIGAGRRKPTGVIDVALIQSLVRRGEISDMVADYGHLVVDECHHLSGASFELVVRRAKARYVLGLSATVARKDGHHPIIFMQCGPVRHRVDARAQAAGGELFTAFSILEPLGEIEASREHCSKMRPQNARECRPQRHFPPVINRLSTAAPQGLGHMAGFLASL